MERLFEEVNKVTPEIIEWIKMSWKQLSEYIINANDKIDLAKQAIGEMLKTSGWVQLITLGICIGIIRISIQKLFKR